jgi:mannose-6-phosphate isomerase-like protein (cupin superfamily)
VYRPAIAAPFTRKNLADVEDSAPGFGFAEIQEAHFAGKDLEAQDVGFAYHRVKPNKRSGFGHRHEEAEEVYVVLSGSGRIKLDDEIVELRALDAIRVSPPVTRAFEAGPDGLEYLAFGPRTPGDGELVMDWWTE